MQYHLFAKWVPTFQPLLFVDVKFNLKMIVGGPRSLKTYRILYFLAKSTFFATKIKVNKTISDMVTGGRVLASGAQAQSS